MGQGRGCGGSGVVFFFSFPLFTKFLSAPPCLEVPAEPQWGGGAVPALWGAPTRPNLAKTSADGSNRVAAVSLVPCPVSRVLCPMSRVPCPVPAASVRCREPCRGARMARGGQSARAGGGQRGPPSWAGWAGLSPRTAPVLCGGAGAGTRPRPPGSCGWAAAHLEARSWASRGGSRAEPSAPLPGAAPARGSRSCCTGLGVPLRMNSEGLI